MKKIKIVIFLIVIALLITACSKKQFLHFETNGGNVIEDAEVNKGEFKMPDNPYKDGYSFDGWHLDNDTFLNSFNTNYFKDTDTKSDLTIYAKWKKDTYAIKFETYGGNEIASINDYIIQDNPVTSKKGYTLDGWYLNNGFTGEKISFPYDVKNDVTLFAKWIANSYKISLINTDSLLGSVTGNGNYDYDSTVTLTATANNGYNFKGWYQNEILINDSINYSFKMPDKDIDLQAKWSVNKYTVSFINDVSKGIVIGQNDYEYNSDVTITATPNDSYYLFVWNINNIYTKMENPYTFKMPSHNLEITPVWLCKFDYTESNNQLTITGFNSLYLSRNPKEIIIPRTIDNKNVVAIFDNAFINATEVTKVYIPETITNFSYNTFTNCTNVSDLTIPLNYFNANLSLYTNNLTSLNLLSNTVLNEIYDDNGENSFSKEISDTLVNLTLGEGITRIGNYAFLNCLKLTAVTFPDSLLSIGYNAFENCKELTDVNINSDSNIEIISENAFYNCIKLSSFNLPINVEILSMNSFSFCTNMTVFNIPIGTKLISIEDNALSYSGILSINIPDNVLMIGNFAFTFCTGLTNVNISNTSQLNSIGISAFEGCESLLNILIPENVTIINDDTFRDCKNLTSITISSLSLESLEDEVFYGCEDLISVKINCSAVPSLGSGVFIQTGDVIISNLKIYVPSASLNTFKIATGWSEYNTHIFALTF